MYYVLILTRKWSCYGSYISITDIPSDIFVRDRSECQIIKTDKEQNMFNKVNDLNDFQEAYDRKLLEEYRTTNSIVKALEEDCISDDNKSFKHLLESGVVDLDEDHTDSELFNKEIINSFKEAMIVANNSNIIWRGKDEAYIAKCKLLN